MTVTTVKTQSAQLLLAVNLLGASRVTGLVA